MNVSKRDTIKYKLVAMVMMVTVSTLIIVGLFFVSVDQYAASNAMSSRINILAGVISDRISAAIMFDDKDVAEQMLSSLKQDESILMACAYSASGELAGKYSKNRKVNCPDIFAKSNYRNDDRLNVVHQILFKGEDIGDLFLSASYTELEERLLWFVIVVVTVTFIASVFVLFSILTLQKNITAPLIKLRDITDDISKRGDYSQILPKAGEDEIGSLCRSFGLMIEQIQLREAGRQKAENTLRQSENRFRALVENAPICIYELDLDGYLTSMNPGGVKMMGFSNESSIIALQYLDLVCEEDRSDTDGSLLKALDGQAVFFEFKAASKKSLLFSSSLAPIKDHQGNVQRLMGVSIDITEQKSNEIALRRAQKMEAIGQLTGGIAHDFNNILGIVMGNLQILEMKLEGSDEALGRIKKALKATQRGADITRQLLRFSRFQNQKTELIDVNKVIGNMDELVTKSLTVAIEVKTHFTEGVWPVNVDPGDLEDAVLNLSLNAKDAMPAGGCLVIETSNKVLDDNYVKCNPESKSGDFVMISVSDNGLGMAEETKNKVLEPFFTTKEQGKGTGLGLSMVYGFIQRSGGHIKIYSELAEGTTFNLFLPRATEDALMDVRQSGICTALPKGTETILIVDDEEALADIAAEYLKQLGYSVLVSLGTKQALEVIDKIKNIDLVFSDIIMPGGMDGYQLAEAVHETYPSYKVLLTSGFTKQREESIGVENLYLRKLAANRLHKPYNQSELAFAIRNTLDDTTIFINPKN